MKGKRLVNSKIAFWTAIGCLNALRGFMTSLKPSQSQDLQTVIFWSATWLWQGKSPYHLPAGLTANYPPYTVGFLSVLALVPFEWARMCWSALNIALAPLAAFLAFRMFRPEASGRDALMPCMLFLSWADVRIGLGNGQLSLLMLTFGVLAVVCSDKRPCVGGTLLALSLMKPHVGAAFFLWAMWTKRFKIVAVSIVVMSLGLLVFSVRVGENPVSVAYDFISVLRRQFGGEQFLPGVLELRPLVHAIIPKFLIAETVHLLILVSMLGIIGVVGWKGNSLERRQQDTIVLQLCSLWALMAVFHNSYDAIMLLPVMVGMYVFAVPEPPMAKQSLGTVALWLLQLTLVVGVPGLWWRLSGRFDLSGYDRVGQWISHFDRVVVMCLFVYLVFRARLDTLESRHPCRRATGSDDPHGVNGKCITTPRIR